MIPYGLLHGHLKITCHRQDVYNLRLKSGGKIKLSEFYYDDTRVRLNLFLIQINIFFFGGGNESFSNLI